MASIGSVTRQISALEITNKKATTAQGSNSNNRLLKQPSQQSVSKLLTKYAAPNPFTNASNKPINSSSLRNPTPTTLPSTNSSSSSIDKIAIKHGHGAHPSIDIGKYDGGLEIDNEKRGEKVYGKAAEDLALDSSVSEYDLVSFLTLSYLILIFSNAGNTLPENGACTSLKWVALSARVSSAACIWSGPNANLGISSL
jgi:hypothetical protein